MRTSGRTAIAALALLAHLAVAVAPATAHEGAVEPVLPADRPARGMIFEGLVPTREDSPCGGSFRIALKDRLACTHGPDPAPPGLDVREHQSVAELRARTFGSTARASAAEDVEEEIPCIGDGVNGRRVKVIYARAAGVPDRFAPVRDLIEVYAARASRVIDESAAQTGGSRKVRFVTTPSPGCELDIDSVTLSDASVEDFMTTIYELRLAGYTDSDRKYLVFMDATRICGIAEFEDDEAPGPENVSNGGLGRPGMFARVDSNCWPVDYAAAHELVHTFGGVQDGAPHSTGGGHCYDWWDAMCQEEGLSSPRQFLCPQAEKRLLDCGDDDYFNTDPPPGSYLARHWNVADSAFLTGPTPAPPPPGPTPPPPPGPTPPPPPGPTPPKPVPPAPAPTPSTSIFAGPTGAVRGRQAAFRFGSDGSATFVCRLDGGKFETCASPKRYRGLSPGRHAFRVAARSDEGLVDPSPAVRRFRTRR